MKIINENQDKIVIRFDRGDELISEIGGFCAERKISGAFFWGIGAAEELTLSYYDLDSKQYDDHVFAERLEITGITGNVAMFKNELKVHTHGTFADRDMVVRGGHIKHLIVSATAEICLQVLGPMKRTVDKTTGLPLLS